MQVSLFSIFGLGAGMTTAGILAAIVVLACVLGAEIAGICILISKMLRASKARREYSREEENRDNQASYHYHNAAGAFLLLGAIPQTSYTVLTVLAVLSALAAVVFVVLLIVFRACGYDFAVTDKSGKIGEDHEADTSPKTLSEEDYAYAYFPDDEEQAQEASTPPAEDEIEEIEEETEDEPLSVFDEGSDSETQEIVAAAPEQGTTVTTTTVSEEPVFADGTHPYKVVEKVVTETVKEIYRENPTAAQETQKSGTDAVMEKLADFLEYELQKRKENDAQENDPESVPTFAEADPSDADVEDEDEDEDDFEEDAEDGKRDEDDDVDDEENDTEGDHFTGSERIIGFDEETGCYIVAHYRKSFEAKLIQSRPNIKQYYSELKNALLSYGGTKSRISWAADSFSNERTPIAKINVKTRTLELYLALDPASLEDDGVYKGQDVGNKKRYADTPFRYKIRSPRKLKWALELVQRTCEEHGLSPIDAEQVNYEEQYPFDTTENLVERKLIKEYIRQEKPATTFELDPDHVPEVPAEDESVIPANANFSWEFDNEVMEAEAEAEEPVAEEIVADEPEQETEDAPVAEEPATAEPAPSIYKETVKVTEMRYTERYYANGEPTYEQVITTEEPMPVISEPVMAEFEDHTETNEETAPETEDGEPIFDNIEPEAEAADPFAVYDDLTDMEDPADEAVFEDAVEESEEEPTEEYGEDTSADIEEEALEDEEPENEYVVESEPIEEEPVKPAPAKAPANPAIAVVDLRAVEEYFPMGAVIDLESLKAKELILPTATTLKVYTSGPISKTFTVEANHFTLDAIQAITDADGDSVMVR